VALNSPTCDICKIFEAPRGLEFFNTIRHERPSSPDHAFCILGCALQYSKKSGVPLPDSSGSLEEAIRGVRSA